MMSFKKNQILEFFVMQRESEGFLCGLYGDGREGTRKGEKMMMISILYMSDAREKKKRVEIHMGRENEGHRESNDKKGKEESESIEQNEERKKKSIHASPGRERY